MIRLRRSLRTRFVVVFGATFVVMQLANAAYLLLSSRRAGRMRLESAARQYALIATPVVAQSFDSYFDSGYFKFRQLVIDLLARSEDVTAILICDVEGRVLFDSRRMESTPADASVELPGSPASGSRRCGASSPRRSGRRLEMRRVRSRSWCPTSRTGAVIASR